MRHAACQYGIANPIVSCLLGLDLCEGDYDNQCILLAKNSCQMLKSDWFVESGVCTYVHIACQ